MTDTDRSEYRAQVRKTLQAMSDQALSFQDARIPRNGNIDRQELERELSRRSEPVVRDPESWQAVAAEGRKWQ